MYECTYVIHCNTIYASAKACQDPIHRSSSLISFSHCLSARPLTLLGILLSATALRGSRNNMGLLSQTTKRSTCRKGVPKVCQNRTIVVLLSPSPLLKRREQDKSQGKFGEEKVHPPTAHGQASCGGGGEGGKVQEGSDIHTEI